MASPTDGSNVAERRDMSSSPEQATLSQHESPTVAVSASPVLRRAGLLHPMAQSYSSQNVFPQETTESTESAQTPHPRRVPHSQDTIRDSTVELSSMIMMTSPPTSPAMTSSTKDATPSKKYIFPLSPGPTSQGSPRDNDDDKSSTISSLSMDLSSTSASVISSSGRESNSSADDAPVIPSQHPSGLSVLLRSRAPSEERDDASTPRALRSPSLGGGGPPESQYGDDTITAGTTPQATPRIGPTRKLSGPSTPSHYHYGSSTMVGGSSSAGGDPSERTPLLGGPTKPIDAPNGQPPPPGPPKAPLSAKSLKARLQSAIPHIPKDALTLPHLKQLSRDTSNAAVKAIPAVILGCLLNVLDGLSYGMIAFPASPPFVPDELSSTGFDGASTGVSMFFITAIISQLVYTFGGSGFAGANGSMMIEVVPFFHILGATITKDIGIDTKEQQLAVVATTMASFILSSLLTGITFFLLGALRLGAIIGFFPRHILVGCIGGVGWFLIETGLAVSVRISDDEFSYNWTTFKLFFFDTHNLALWTIPLALAIILRIITSRWNHQLLFPIYFLVIPLVFYIVVAARQLDLSELRETGWIFDVGSSAGNTKTKWYSFYSFLDFRYIRGSAIWATLPTQFALLFFNILHPPLNVPALSVSLNEDVDTNKELVAHGYSNFLAGLVGTLPNYLVYVNTLLFYRVGGGTRIAGFMLALATFILLIIGTGPIAYIPVMVVGALIFVLGIDLVKEALWDTRHRVTKLEYLTIISIMVCMTAWDFVIGVLFGIVMSCFFFVVQNSQRRSIRAFHTGETVLSTVRRPSSQRDYIREVSKQTTILRLQGFLFFGTITYVEETIRDAIEGPSWSRNPVRFLLLDLTLVGGVDMSAAEAFVRIHRLLSARGVTLVFCGFEADGPIGKALASVDVLGADGVELFATFNSALEWTENAYLRAWFRSQKTETSAVVLPGRQDADIRTRAFLDSFVGSPRLSHLHRAGKRTIANDPHTQVKSEDNAEPFNTIVKAFSSFGDVDDLGQLRPLSPYLERVVVPEGHVLWNQGDAPDGLYVIESGILRASYHFAEYTQSIEESMVPGTLAGELSALSDLPRNATTVAERQSVLWRLSTQNLEKLQVEKPELSRLFLRLVVKAAKVDYDILLSALATRQ